MPDCVAGAVAAAMEAGLANLGSSSAASRDAAATVAAARSAVADLLGAEPATVVWGRSMTQITYDLSRAIARGWVEGDEVVVTSLDHEANIGPWVQAAAAAGASVRFADFDPATGRLDAEAFAEVVTERTRVVACTGASNLIGSRPPLEAIAAVAHSVGAVFYVDGVHLTPHAPVDISAIGADFYVCSPYKFMGPHCGVAVARPELLAGLHPDKLATSPESVPERFELGTLPYELLAGVTAAVDLIAGLASADATPGPGRRRALLDAMGEIEHHESDLLGRLVEMLGSIPGVEMHPPVAGQARTPTLLLSLSGQPSGKVADALAERGVNAPAGSFYAPRASTRLGLGTAGAVRVGLAPYTDFSDLDRLASALSELV